MSGDTNPIDNTIDQLNKVETSKSKHLTQLKTNIGGFQQMHTNSFVMMMIFMFGIMSGGNGSLFSNQVNGNLKTGGSDGNIISTQEDKIREVAVQKTVTNAFSSVQSAGQTVFNSAGNVSDLQTQLGNLQDAINTLNPPNGTPIAGSPFDNASASSMNGALTQLQADIATVNSTYGGSLSNLYNAAKTPGNVGAASLIKDFNDQFSTISTTVQTISNTTSTNMQLVNADYQQFLGMLNNLLQAFHKQTDAAVQNQPKGS